ncbi:DUF4252 domain-containing protein [Chitinophaga japonensis]|uniref:Uncharacterized protein DUF4252 n=1 Tax=Chitinophaga japonensis TaxID=104662 RepID=A0A562SLZ9_CHIJA|nr:DUF4252 domain-containing protein [Chitinophaga japonensis]TWI82381.1 uncharacterized protein DUF4252 [Chitinophaga japonensis]
MKTLITCCLLLALAAGPVSAQRKYLKEFQREYRGKAETYRIGLGFLAKIGGALLPASLIDEGEDKETAVVVKRMLRKVKRMKLYVIQAKNSDAIDRESLYRLRQNLADKAGLEPLLEVRDQGSTVYMMNKGKGDELGNVVVLIKDESELVMLHLRTRMLMKDIQDLIDLAKN